ncbi:hypothetical protein GCM10010978_07040 [Compostibacillus humi]|uniref:SRPBCC family protein n=1 Tax=Compostibacillus humi TaxID=1245525 RepID=A0A8J2ZQP5_9BACI|nr:SRPBCC family protein [Compostibacillus humi]GGH71277.1 hypothetical protein GCM10010978_07040 [Compostibacillus humi]
MASGIHHVEMDLPISVIWNFVKDFDHWAPLLPGYVEHWKLDSQKSIWKLQGEIGKVRKQISVQVELTEVQAPTFIAFSLSVIDYPCSGQGYFTAAPITDRKTKITGSLEISAKGMMGPMMNSVLKAKVPKLGREFTERVAKEIAQRQPLFV